MSVSEHGPAEARERIAFEVFFDGECPLCRREIALLRKRDRQGRLRFTDIAAPDFDPRPLGLDLGALMSRIHGRLPGGELVSGVEVFRQLYAAIGFERFVALSRLPVIAPLLESAYAVFSANRLRLTGRCTRSTCDLPREGAAPASGRKLSTNP